MNVDAFMASEFPAKIRVGLQELIERNEESDECEAHHFDGFCLPKLDLRGAEFQKPVFFNHAEFFQDVILSEAGFGRDVNFSHAVFHGAVDLYSMAFYGNVDFEWSRFKSDVVFCDSIIEGRAYFADAMVEADLVFETETFRDDAVFANLKIRKDGRLIFTGTDLSRATFGDLNLERVDFHRVKWFRPKQSKLWGSRNALREEFSTDTSNSPEIELSKTAQSYRQLVLNYERNRDFESAEDFHIGEMEMRRRMRGARARNTFLKFVWGRLNSYAFYLYLSRYGTSYITALIWLLSLVLLAFPVLYMWSGFDIFDPISGSRIRSVHQESILGIKDGTVWLWDWIHSINFSISVATFQHSKHIEPLGESTEVLSAIESVMVAGLSALMLFAVRRRFRR
jgi:hypothetical protein